MLLKVSSEGYDYLTELRNIPDPEDEDGFHTLGSDKSEIEAADEMVLQLYSVLGPKSDTYFSDQIPGTDTNTRGLIRQTVRRLYQTGYLENTEEGVII